ncbi:type II toxin-antitoxin system HicB family antitoxin [Nibribacter koreensis]|uniref:Type II toxin-antitoxin system HicB family antitoxin n=2 Tax=Nibribacter koreensis TaxID=1084519 RepID=A0ABP8G406_9BACT
MEYKGFIGSVNYSSTDEVFHGKIEFVTDLVTFEGTSISELKTAFQESVDDYIEFCKETGKTPEKSLKGVFNVRVKPEIHRKAAILAVEKKISLNQVVADALSQYVGHAHV